MGVNLASYAVGDYLPLGGGTLTAPLNLAVGSAALPGLTFTGDPNSGLYWIQADNIGLALNGGKVLDITASLFLMLGDIGMNLGGYTGKFTHAITAARTWTFPDEALTVAGKNVDNAFSTVQTFAAGIVVTTGQVIKPNVDTGLLQLQGDTAGADAFLIYGKTHSTKPGRIELYNSNASGDAAIRLSITGNLATAVATWSTITHTGLVLGGTLDVNNNQLTNLSDLIFQNTSPVIRPPDSDDSYLDCRARNNGVALATVMKILSAADPRIEATLGMTLPEMTAPAAVANNAFLFAQDNGSGKTQLMVQMPTGAAIQIAIEA